MWRRCRCCRATSQLFRTGLAIPATERAPAGNDCLAIIRHLHFVQLNGFQLSGILPDFSGLDALQVIILSNNTLTGPVPEFLSSLPNLQTLDLSDNDFDNIPASLANKECLTLITNGNNKLERQSASSPGQQPIPPPPPAEKSLVECAYDLRSELENAASDVSGLFAKIERKDKIEDGNRILVQKFQSQLTEQLDLLHNTVSIFALQQENQLKEMEEDMQLFVSSKIEATEELRGRVGNLKAIYGSGIRSLDDLAGELDGNSLSTSTKMNEQVLSHSCAVEDCFRGIASEADQLLNDLQSNLSDQEQKLAAFAQQQREGNIRAVETTRSISKITSEFFHSLDIHVSRLSKIMEETQTVQDKKLLELEKKFEECAANEERQIIERVAEMLASSTSRKKIVGWACVTDELILALTDEGLCETSSSYGCADEKMQEEARGESAGLGYKCDQPSPISILEASFSTDSCLSESLNSMSGQVLNFEETEGSCDTFDHTLNAVTANGRMGDGSGCSEALQTSS